MTGGHGSGLRARVRARFSGVGQSANERGFTLIETVITVWILGLVSTTFVAVLFGMTTSAYTQDRVAAGDAEVRRAADWVSAKQYIPCAGSTGAALAIDYLGGFARTSGFTYDVTVRFSSRVFQSGLYNTQVGRDGWKADNPATWPEFVSDSPGGTCPDSDSNIQEATVVVTFDDGAIQGSQSATVMKRNE
jgi:prepilin-type N-terminal cleavage/methylation domain-containing protein